MADGVAHCASLGRTQRILPSRSSLFMPSEALNWMWLKWSLDAHAYPPLHSNGFFYFQQQPSVATRKDLYRNTVDENTCEFHSLNVEIKFIVTNVLTFEDCEGAKPKNKRIENKAQLVRKQFHQHKPHIVAAFETRTRAGSFEDEHFYVHSSGALKGNYGVQIWISKTSPYAVKGDNKFKFALRDFTQIQSDPRRLIGRIFPNM
jgi:hypothetical protein